MEGWHWIPSEENIADINTKGAKPSQLGPKSEWQNGPAFLTRSRATWPIKTVHEIRKKPSEGGEKVVPACNSTQLNT